MTSRARNGIILMLIKRLFSLSDLVLVLTDVEKVNIEHWYGINPSRITVLTNCIDFGGDKEKLRTATNRNSKVNLLFFGRLHESKGVQDIVSAVEKMTNKEGVYLTVCGEGPLRSWFCEQMERLLGQNFIYKGIVKGDDKWGAFEDMDYFLLPSRYGEGLPMALLETMSSGIVPITSDNSSLTNLVDESNGYIVKPGDTQALQNILDSIVNNKEDRESKSLRCKNIVEANFSCSDMRSNLLSIYENIA